MKLSLPDLIKKANKLYPGPGRFQVYRDIYIKGYQAAVEDLQNNSKNFYTELATKLRDLWPVGEKDGKWPWRDSVGNLSKRLQFLWKERNLGDKYTIDDCLRAARRYLAQYETNAKYMQILKYFIYKQTSDMVSSKSGKITCSYKSNLADLLEGQAAMDAQEDFAAIFESSNTLEQGELI